MIGLVGLNWFNQNNTVGRDLWAITLAEGGGNPTMKVNPIYVKEPEKTESDEKVSESSAETSEENKNVGAAETFEEEYDSAYETEGYE
ncbi:MAG: hypothetical protein K5776_12225 [Lachnospiraceae bacterium]|nr:hypothetical protein [Lachnospiraceae bacterium]